MRRFTYYLIFVSFVLFGSCSYEFSADYYKDIEITDPTAKLILKDFENDITLTAPVYVAYQYDGDNRHRLYRVEIHIDNTYIKSGSEESGTFYINVGSLNDGTHEIKVVYYFSSGSGSLADGYNQEGYVTTQIYKFNVDKSIGDAPNLTSVEIADGTLYIHWDPLTHSDFKQAYLIIKNENQKQLNQILLTEEQLNSGVYNDRLSVHYALLYSIMLVNTYTSSRSNEVAINIPELELTVEILNQNQHAMHWKAHPLYGNFDHFQYTGYGYSNKILDAKGGELIFNTPPVFGEKLHHNLNIYRDDRFLGSIQKILHFGKPFSTTRADAYVYNPSTNAYYALKTDGKHHSGAVQQVFLHQLDAEDLSVIATVQLDNIEATHFRNLTLDPSTNNLIVDTKLKSYELNSNDLTLIQSWKTSDFNYNDYISDVFYRNGYMIIADYYGGRKFSIYNAESKVLVHAATINNYFKVSDDGQYFYNQNAIYKLENNTVSVVTSTDTSSFINAVTFLPDQNKCIYNSRSSSPVIYDFITHSKTVLSEITGVNDLKYDFSSNQVFIGQYHTSPNDKSFVNIYNMNTQTYKRLEVYDSHYVGIYFTFLNGTLIFSDGLYLDDYFNNL